MFHRISYRSYPPGARSIWVIVGTCVAVLIATVISPQIIGVLGLMPARFASQPWTIITNLFVHGGFWHLFANMFTLYFFGTSLMRLLGERRFLLVYAVGGVLGNIFYLLLAPPLSIAVGASGAVFAVAGTLTVLAPKLRVFVFPIPVPLPLWVAVIGGFLILSLLPSVAWQAHLGGLVLGLIAGLIFRRKRYYSY